MTGAQHRDPDGVRDEAGEPAPRPLPRRPVFFCPTCGGDRGYERGAAAPRWRVRRRPTAMAGPDIVVCTGCRTGHSSLALLEPTNAAIGEAVADALRHALVAVLRAEPRPAPDPRLAAAAAAAAPLGAPGTDPEALDEAVRSVDDAWLEAVCRRAGRVLLPEGRWEILRACVRAARTDGPPSAPRRAAVRRVGAGLGCAPAEVDALLAWAAHGT